MNLPPISIATIRAGIEVALMGALGAVITALSAADWGEYAIWSPLIFAGLRFLEGAIDQIDPKRKRA